MNDPRPSSNPASPNPNVLPRPATNAAAAAAAAAAAGAAAAQQQQQQAAAGQHPQRPGISMAPGAGQRIGAAPAGLPRPGMSPQQQPQVRPGMSPQHPSAYGTAPQPAPPPPLPQQHGLPRQSGPTMPPPSISSRRPAVDDEEPVALVEDDDDQADGDSIAAAEAPIVSKIKYNADAGGVKKHAWKRQLKPGGTGACRVRTFHGKLSDQGLEYIDEAINVWLDEHPEIDIKFVTSNVGMFDGKFKDLALIVNVWY